MPPFVKVMITAPDGELLESFHVMMDDSDASHAYTARIVKDALERRFDIEEKE